MNLEIRITALGRSYVWRSGDDPEQLDAAIEFLQEQKDLHSSAVNPSKPIVTDDPDFILANPK